MLELDELLNFAVVDVVDLESAAVWWDEHATPAWAGALDEAASDG